MSVVEGEVQIPTFEREQLPKVYTFKEVAEAVQLLSDGTLFMLLVGVICGLLAGVCWLSLGGQAGTEREVMQVYAWIFTGLSLLFATPVLGDMIARRWRRDPRMLDFIMDPQGQKLLRQGTELHASLDRFADLQTGCEQLGRDWARAMTGLLEEAPSLRKSAQTCAQKQLEHLWSYDPTLSQVWGDLVQAFEDLNEHQQTFLLKYETRIQWRSLHEATKS